MAESKTKGFGERLRRAREEAGRDVKSLADVTRVQGRYISALENEDWSVVPKGVIGRGFVRVLAREIGLPPAELLQLYQAARGDADSEPDRSLPEVDWKVDLGSGRKGTPFILGGAAILLAALAFWWWGHRSTGRKEPLPPEAPAVSEAAPAPAAAPVPAPPSAPASPPSGAAVTAPPPVAPVKAEPQPAPNHGPLRLELEATRDRVWVRVTEDGGAPRERLLKAGEKVAYQASSVFHVKLGNAGAVKLFWNGAALKSPGRSSQVVVLTLPKDLPSLQP